MAADAPSVLRELVQGTASHAASRPGHGFAARYRNAHGHGRGIFFKHSGGGVPRRQHHRSKGREAAGEAEKPFGKAAAGVRQRISDLRSIVGSPWTRDEKTAALAGLMVCDKTRWQNCGNTLRRYRRSLLD